MSDGTFASPDLSTFCRLDELGLAVVGQRVGADRAVLACRVVEPDDWCRQCGCQGIARVTVVRRLAHEPFGWRPTTLEVTIRRYPVHRVWACVAAGHVQGRAAPGEDLPPWAAVGPGGDCLRAPRIARVAAGLAVAWDTANTAVLAEGKRVLITGEDRFEGVHVVGVDEHVWRHTRRGE